VSDFKLHFNNDEENLLARGKATFGNQLGHVLKDGLIAALNGGVKPAEQPEEHEDRSAKLESIMIRHFGDIKNENLWIEDEGSIEAAKVAIDGRFGNLYAKCAGDDRLFLDARIEFERKYPKLARITGMTEE